MMLENTSVLDPFPEGWYFVASRNAILKEKLIQRTWLGDEIVVWCDTQGRICVAEAVCPHLGAQLGPGAGGQVRDGCLVCPFHGFEYDASGQCVATPFAPAPRSARLKVFETREILGMVFAWWGIGGRPPQWKLHEDPLDAADWSELKFATFRFPGHPQETTENSVDLAHLRYVHGYSNVGRPEPVTVDGAYLLSCFDFVRTRTVAGIAKLVFDTTALTHIYGLGYSFVDISEHSIGMSARLWVLATPLDGERIELVLVSQMRDIPKPKRPIVGLWFLPLRLRTRALNHIMLSAQRRDVMQDVVIWKGKRYRQRPRVCRSDGEIALFRRYCEQFYPNRREDSTRNKPGLRSIQA